MYDYCSPSRRLEVLLWGLKSIAHDILIGRRGRVLLPTGIPSWCIEPWLACDPHLAKPFCAWSSHRSSPDLLSCRLWSYPNVLSSTALTSTTLAGQSMYLHNFRVLPSVTLSLSVKDLDTTVICLERTADSLSSVWMLYRMSSNGAHRFWLSLSVWLLYHPHHLQCDKRVLTSTALNGITTSTCRPGKPTSARTWTFIISLLPQLTPDLQILYFIW